MPPREQGIRQETDPAVFGKDRLAARFQKGNVVRVQIDAQRMVPFQTPNDLLHEILHRAAARLDALVNEVLGDGNGKRAGDVLHLGKPLALLGQQVVGQVLQGGRGLFDERLLLLESFLESAPAFLLFLLVPFFFLLLVGVVLLFEPLFRDAAGVVEGLFVPWRHALFQGTIRRHCHDRRRRPGRWGQG